VGLPNVGIFGDPHVLIDLAVRAEHGGWDAVFLWDHLLYRDASWPVADPLVALAAMASHTSTVRLGVMVFALPRRRPWLVAKQLATLDWLSEGRLTVGVGLGSLPGEYEGFGESADAAARGRRLDESLDIVTDLWSGRPVEYAGEHYTINGVRLLPTPVQQPRPPIWCAGRWPNQAPFRRAARYDGVIPTHRDYGLGLTMPPEELANAVAFVAAARTDAQVPFDVAIEGRTKDSGSSVDLRAYAEAGATWWVEALGWWRGDLTAAHERIDQGPSA
jgi:probable F420-dependent oxidoreductase